MAKANALQKGDYVEIDNEPLRVVEHEFVKPGKGGAFVRLKLKSCLNSAVRKETYPSETDITAAEISSVPFQFLYAQGGEYHCMDTESYDQFVISAEEHKQKGQYMQEGGVYAMVQWNERIIDIELPLKIAYEVQEAAEMVRGNTVGGATKTVIIQNNIQVKVPLFIGKGDTILINTSTGKYVERVNR